MVSALELQLRQSSSGKVIPGQKPFGRVVAPPTRITSSQTVLEPEEPPKDYEVIKTSSGVPRFVRYRKGGRIRQEPIFTTHQDVEGRVSYFENKNLPKDISSEISMTFPEPQRRWELSGSYMMYGSYKRPATVTREGRTVINPELHRTNSKILLRIYNYGYISKIRKETKHNSNRWVYKLNAAGIKLAERILRS